MARTCTDLVRRLTAALLLCAQAARIWVVGRESLPVSAFTRVQYTASDRRLVGSGEYAYVPSARLERISILGVASAPTEVTVNGQVVAFSYVDRTLALTGLQLSPSAALVVTW